MIKTAAALASAILLASAGLACSKAPAKIAIAPPKADLIGKDSTVTLKASVMDSKDQGLPQVPVSWRSSDDKVASVDPGGIVTAKSSGEAIISARAAKVVGEAKVSVIIVGKLEVSLPDSGLAGAPGTKVPLRVKILDENGREIPNIPVNYEISPPAVASVDKSGTVTLLTPGSITLKASAGKVVSTIRSEVLIQVPKFLKLTKGEMAVKKGETIPLEYDVFDEKGRTIKVPPVFSSADESVATVDAKGVVTGVGPGSVDITIAVGLDKRQVKVIVR